MRLEGLSVTNPNGLKAGESCSVSLFLVWSWSEALAVTLNNDLLVVMRQLGIWDLEMRGEEGGRRLRGRESRGGGAQAMFWLWLLELGC